MKNFRTAGALLVALYTYCAGAIAGTVSVAVAANFADPVQRIAAAFEQATGHKADVSLGATGKFYAQIRNGAPFDVLLSADEDTPRKLEEEGAAVASTRFVYAVGKLVLWSPKPGVVDDRGAVLGGGNFEHLAICNPKLAPYGAAAVETMKALGSYDRLAATFVEGENISQAYQFVATGNAQLGFVALSQVMQDGKLRAGSAWIVPQSLYRPLRQAALLLDHGKDNAAARAWLDWLRRDDTKALIRGYGYETP